MALVKDALLGISNVLDGTRLVYDAEALFASRRIIQAEIEGRPVSPEWANALIRDEIALTAGADAVVTVSARDAQLFAKHQPASVYMLSYAGETASETADFNSRHGFLFVGRLLAKEAPIMMA